MRQGAERGRRTFDGQPSLHFEEALTKLRVRLASVD
jgi:hypothetical protein